MKKLIASVMINTIVATSVMAIGVDAAEKVEQEKQLECLALNVYYETHARSLADAMAVTDVVLNRVETTRYPNTPCEVVHQGYERVIAIANLAGIVMVNQILHTMMKHGKNHVSLPGTCTFMVNFVELLKAQHTITLLMLNHSGQRNLTVLLVSELTYFTGKNK